MQQNARNSKASSSVDMRFPRRAGFLGAFLAVQLLSVSGRLLTPNGDGRNDVLTVSLDNPADAAVAGWVYSLRGLRVAAMAPGGLPNTLVWDPRSGGATAPGGIYIYVVLAGERVFTGTVAVIR